MTAPPHMRILNLLGPSLAAASLLAALGGGAAAQTSEAVLDHGRVRLLAGEASPAGLAAGVEISLDAGWKTYWRLPGESGVPPRFDWSGSLNVAEVEVRWPAPARHVDAGGETLGYTDRVVFPLTVVPRVMAEPVTLDLKLDFAVCKDICVPAEAVLSRPLGGEAAPEDARLIREYEALVPEPASAKLAVGKVRLVGDESSLRLTVALTGEVGSSTDIFVEGFEDAYFRAPQRARSEGATTVFELPIEGLRDRAALAGRRLTLTVVSGDARLVREVQVE